MPEDKDYFTLEEWAETPIAEFKLDADQEAEFMAIKQQLADWCVKNDQPAVIFTSVQQNAIGHQLVGYTYMKNKGKTSEEFLLCDSTIHGAVNLLQTQDAVFEAMLIRYKDSDQPHLKVVH